MLLFAAAAAAATVTELPVFLRGDVGIRYGWSHTQGALVERGDVEEVVGDRTMDLHQLTYALAFAPAPGTAVFVEIPHGIAQSIRFPTSQQMVYDPGTGTGTSIGTDALEPDLERTGSGLSGVWIGLRGTPYSEAFPRRQNRATWLIEGALRTGSASTFYNGGSGDGAPAFRLGSAFSTTVGPAQPYLTAALTWARPAERETNAGTTTVDPGTAGTARVGAEILTGHNDASGAEFRIDVHLDLDYQAAGVIPSGYELPSVLDASSAASVQSSEWMQAGGGLGLIWRPMTYLQLGVDGTVGYAMPRRIESAYPIYTGGDTISARLGSHLTVRVR